jgi:hypothetical protein
MWLPTIHARPRVWTCRMVFSLDSLCPVLCFGTPASRHGGVLETLFHARCRAGLQFRSTLRAGQHFEMCRRSGQRTRPRMTWATFALVSASPSLPGHAELVRWAWGSSFIFGPIASSSPFTYFLFWILRKCELFLLFIWTIKSWEPSDCFSPKNGYSLSYSPWDKICPYMSNNPYQLLNTCLPV